MDKKTVKHAVIIVLMLASGLCASAQEEESPAAKKPAPKALQEARAKYREKKMKEKAKAEAEAKAKALDINRATLEELKKIPGLTDEYAKAIIAKRPYKSKAAVVTKNAIPLGVYQSIRKQIAVK